MLKPHQKIWNEIANSYHHVSVTSFSHIDKIDSVANKIIELKPKSILNLGCGSGVLERALTKKNYHGNIIAVDSSAEMLSIAKSNNNQENIRFIQADLNRDRISSVVQGSQDIIVLMNVLFLLDDKKNILDQIYSLLSQNGVLILVEPKPKGNILSFFFDHLYHKRKKVNDPKFENVNFAKKIKTVGNMLVASRRIDQMEKRGHFRYYSLDELLQLLIETNFNISYTTDIQAKQNWLIIAKKNEEKI